MRDTNYVPTCHMTTTIQSNPSTQGSSTHVHVHVVNGGYGMPRPQAFCEQAVIRTYMGVSPNEDFSMIMKFVV